MNETDHLNMLHLKCFGFIKNRTFIYAFVKLLYMYFAFLVSSAQGLIRLLCRVETNISVMKDDVFGWYLLL